MTTSDVLPAPVLRPSAPSNKWESEYAAFQKLLPQLLLSHRGEYVAIHNGAVVGMGAEKLETARKAYAEYGPVAILVRLIADELPRIVEILSPQGVQRRSFA